MNTDFNIIINSIINDTYEYLDLNLCKKNLKNNEVIILSDIFEN